MPLTLLRVFGYAALAAFIVCLTQALWKGDVLAVLQPFSRGLVRGLTELAPQFLFWFCALILAGLLYVRFGRR